MSCLCLLRQGAGRVRSPAALALFILPLLLLLLLALGWWVLAPEQGAAPLDGASPVASASVQILVFLHRGGGWLPEAGRP
jgi:hypothetical protein